MTRRNRGHGKVGAFLAVHASVTPFLFRPVAPPAQAAPKRLLSIRPDNSSKGVLRMDAVGQGQTAPQPIGLHFGPKFDRNMPERNRLR
jgi:hypothetical protein